MTRTNTRTTATAASDRQAKVDTLKQRLTDAIAELTNDENWSTYLRAAASFGTAWSFNNLMLILLQSQDLGLTPTTLKTYKKWQNVGRQVRRGAKAFYILEPRRRRLTEEEAVARGPAGYGPDGKPAYVLRGFVPSARFDISQTDGKPVPTNPAVPQLLAGQDTTHAWDAIAAQVTAAGYRITRGPCAGANGSTNRQTMEVRVRADVDPAQAVKTLVHELAHIRLDHVADHDEYRKHRGRMESEAESVAFIVTGALGLDSSAYSMPYIARWCDGDLDLLAEIAKRVTDTAQAILSTIGTKTEHQAAA